MPGAEGTIIVYAGNYNEPITVDGDRVLAFLANPGDLPEWTRTAGGDAPTLVVTSEKDAVVPPPYGAHWQHAIPNAALTTLAGAGHLATLEQPEACARLATEFFRHR